MPTSTSTSAPAIILVVDDNDANRSLARHTLEDEGFRVVIATCGVEAIAAYERDRPDCVLLDVRMPDLDGFAVCELIRARPEGASTPVVFLTALRDVDTFEHALRAGGDDFLTKPIRPTELVVRVRTALRLRRMGSELREHVELVRHQRDDVLRLQLQKERLTTFVVHDLKNHVNAMDLHAQLLLRDPALTDDARESAAQIRSSARQLGRMILNLLDISRADEGKLVVKRADFDLEGLVQAVAGELQAMASDRAVALEFALTTPRLRADEDLLRRTLANLIENAIRHAPKNSFVRIASRRKPGLTQLSVTDSGTGVPPALRDKIFDPFVQLEATNRPITRSGRGLGLTFCKFAVEAHGGGIWVEDANPGAAFVLSIPDE